MTLYKRNLLLDIFDYQGNKQCTLYDSSADISGQAVDIFVTYQRNGWKELRFTLPSVCEENGIPVDNYRLDYIKADYRIRLIDDDGIDWYIQSEPRITHQAYSKNVDVTAGHVAQILKTRNLGLEFSDEEGNNVGTAHELLTTVLEGTDWTPGNVAEFYEKDSENLKRRSLKASSKTGAFKLITMICDLFDAKPVFHGDEKTVDILPMNPFSVSKETGLPVISDTETIYNQDIVELHYNQNVSNVTRTVNTENLVTKLYAYGSYGNETDGYCGIDEYNHEEYEYTLTTAVVADTTYSINAQDHAGVTMTRYFTADRSVPAGSKLIWSMLDPLSQMYVWDNHNGRAYLQSEIVDNAASAVDLPATCLSVKRQNWFSFLMDFSYYSEIGLLTDDMLQKAASYQRNAPKMHEDLYAAADVLGDHLTDLSKIIGSIDFCKLSIDQIIDRDGYAELKLNPEYKNGVVYRTDYTKKESNYFKWTPATKLNAKGDPINGSASILYIVHGTSPITWDTAYIKEIDNEDDPSAIQLWTGFSDISYNPLVDRIYLCALDNLNGQLGALQIADQATEITQASTTKSVTTPHPVYFQTTAPGTDIAEANGYAWWWKYDPKKNPDAAPSELYFCFAANGDISWKPVIIDSQMPLVEKNTYWFNWHEGVGYHESSGEWAALTEHEQQKVFKQFGSIYRAGKTRDQYYQGYFDKYTYTLTEDLPAGNYYINSDYETMWVFSTKDGLSVGDTLSYDTQEGQIEQTKDGVMTTLEAKNYRFDNVMYDEFNSSTILIDETPYVQLGPVNQEGELKGILRYMEMWPDLADEVYTVDLCNYNEAQDALQELESEMTKSLGDLYREGWWQSENYVDGDEKKLYEDAFDNLTKIAQPESTYSIKFVDPFSSNANSAYGASDITSQIQWPDINISSAIHLVDPEIHVNAWAYVDKLNKCYDDARKTTLAINTNLTTMNQHSFTDVLTNIADVAASIKGKVDVFNRASAITTKGNIAAERLEGAIDAAKQQLFGGSSTWFTDEAGNIVFVAADGSSAMTLTGNGFCIANDKNEYGDWNWRTFGTGDGFTADLIVAGTISADRIEASSIGMSKLANDVTQKIQQTEILLEPGKITSIVRESEEYKSDLNSIAKAKVYRQEQDPTKNDSLTINEGDLWIKPSETDGVSDESYVWDGSSWVSLVDNEYITELGTRIEQTNSTIEATVTQKVETVVKGEVEKIVGDAVEDIVGEAAEEAVGEAVGNALSEYVKTTEMESAIKASADGITTSVTKTVTESISGTYATKESLSDYATKNDLSGYVTDNELADYPTKTQVTEIASAVIETEFDSITTSVSNQIEQAVGDNSPIVTRLKTAEEKITPESIVSTVVSSDQFTTQYATREQTSDLISDAVSDVNGNVSKLEQNVGSIEAKVQTNEGAITSLQLADTGIVSSVQDANAHISKVEQDADTQKIQVQNNKGNIAAQTARADGITADVKSNSNEIGRLKQTSEEFETKISDAEGNITRLEQDAEQFKISVGQDIEAKTSDATGQQMTLSFDRGGSVEVGFETLTCHVHVWKNGEEVTDLIPRGAFSWQRSSGNASSDATWNAAHKSTKEITLTRDEIGKSCQIKCTLNAKGYYGYFDIIDGTLVIIRPDDGVDDEFYLKGTDLYGDESYNMDEDGYVYKNGVPGQMSVTSTVFDHTVLETSHILIKNEKIEIRSGGDIDILANGSITLEDKAGLNVKSGGNINIQSGGNIDIASGGTFSIVSDNFTVTKEGDVTVKGEIESDSGNIGGWEITGGSLQSGSGTSHVELSTEDPTYAIWAGNETADLAPFRVTKDGKVYLVRVMALANEADTTASEINLSGLPLWKLNRSIVSSITKTDDGFSYTTLGGSGGTITFKKAVGVGTDGSGSVFPVDANGNNIGTTSVSVSADTDSGYVGSGWTSPSSVLVYLDILVGGTVARSGDFVTVDASSIYNGGWKDAAGQWKVSGGDTSFTIDTASSTAVGEPTSKTFTMTKGTPSATGGKAAVSHNGVAVAQIDISDWWNEGYTAGRDSVKVASLVRSTDDIYVGGDSYTTNVYAIATTDTGKTLLHVFSVPGTSAYNEGHDDGVGSVTVSKPTRQAADQYNSSDHSTNVYVLARASNGKTNTETFTVDGTNAYNSGKSAGANSLAISPSTAQTLDYGKTVTVTATTENGSGQTVTKSVDITAPADRYGTGYSAGYAGGKDTYSPTSITRTGYSTADKTVTVKAANSHQDLLTGQVISASEIYDAGHSEGEASVTVSSTGSWSGGSRYVSLSNGKGAYVYMPSDASWATASVGVGQKRVSCTVGGKTYSTTITV